MVHFVLNNIRDEINASMGVKRGLLVIAIPIIDERIDHNVA